MTVVVSETFAFSEDSLELLKKIGPLETGPYAHDELIYAVANATVLMVRLAHKIDEQLLSHAPQLKMVISATTGLNHIDLDACRKRSIEVICLKGERDFLNSISSTAELSMGLLMSLIRYIPAAHNDVCAGNWNRDRFMGQSLFGKTLGIIGMGRLGKLLAGYARAFKMEIIYCDLRSEADCENARLVSLSELLSISDIISLNASHSRTDPTILDRANLALVKPGVLIVNTARGELVDEYEICRLVEQGHIGGYATDVMSDEQEIKANLKEHALVKLAADGHNVIVTPHIGGATIDGLSRAENFVIKKAIIHLGLN